MSKLNARHMQLAWITLGTLAITDFYVMARLRRLVHRPALHQLRRHDSMTERIERHHYDVVVIGAGGAGLRAAIEARLAGKRTAIISKSLFGKAHTVMAEGGAAAAMGNVNSQRQLAGALPRHHARRQVPQQLPDGRAARQGGARTGSGSWRPTARCSTARKDGKISPAQLRRPRVPAAGARR